MLKVENLEYYYGRIHALRGVSFEITPGDLCTIIGSNGAGKSTLMNSLIGLLDATGDIFFEGKKLLRGKPHTRIERGIVLIPEGRRIFPNLTVTENLLMGGYTVKERNRGVQRAFEIFPVLKERQKQRAGTLSGGEQQMLAIGRGLMANPKLLLLDEPSLGLAPMIVNTVMQTIQQINQQGITVLLVEQNAKKALAIANKACVLEQGIIVRMGTGQELLHDPKILEAYLGGTKKHETQDS